MMVPSGLEHVKQDKGWIGVDLDGTLAEYDEWRGETHIGAPIELMVDRIRVWLAEGYEVRIFTARVANEPVARRPDLGNPPIRTAIWDWLEKACSLPRLQITNVKDYRMIELWDDRAVQVVPNTGMRADGEP